MEAKPLLNKNKDNELVESQIWVDLILKRVSVYHYANSQQTKPTNPRGL